MPNSTQRVAAAVGNGSSFISTRRVIVPSLSLPPALSLSLLSLSHALIFAH